MATRVKFLPGYGVFVTSETAEEKMLPGYGVVTFVAEAAPSGPLNLDRISSMHFQRHYEPIAMGV